MVSHITDYPIDTSTFIRDLKNKNSAMSDAIKPLMSNSNLSMNQITLIMLSFTNYINHIIDEITKEKDNLLKTIAK